MSCIYVPRGKAREYSPLALNIYSGCDHHCKYCYVRCIIPDALNPRPRNNIIKELEKEAKIGIAQQVLLCFMSDPYCNLEMHTGLTRHCLEILDAYDVPVAILTKGGTRIFRDMDIILRMKHVKIGATLTFNNDADSREWEQNAALPSDRIEMLSQMHSAGIKTWVSIEPVIDPAQSIALIESTLQFVDQYKIGKLNHNKLADKICWSVFGNTSISILRDAGKDFYIKNDLAKFVTVPLSSNERDPDFLSLQAE